MENAMCDLRSAWNVCTLESIVCDCSIEQSKDSNEREEEKKRERERARGGSEFDFDWWWWWCKAYDNRWANVLFCIGKLTKLMNE